MKYLQDTFTVCPSSNKAYRGNYDRIFNTETSSILNENVEENESKNEEDLKDTK